MGSPCPLPHPRDFEGPENAASCQPPPANHAPCPPLCLAAPPRLGAHCMHPSARRRFRRAGDLGEETSRREEEPSQHQPASWTAVAGMAASGRLPTPCRPRYCIVDMAAHQKSTTPETRLKHPSFVFALGYRYYYRYRYHYRYNYNNRNYYE